MVSLTNLLARFLRHPRPRSSRACAQCHGQSLKRCLATYPVPLTGRLRGRRVDVYRVELDRCRDCGHLMPTPEGQAKVRRCVKVGKRAILESLR
ncbi:hypothetical protein [Acidiferrobacter sp.]|jgi:hypothetical protein|nr:hypothetical protein [Acidiferrobacter sp.]